MFDPKLFDDIAKRLSEAVPTSVRDLEADIEKKFHSILQSTFAKFDLVTREEFDAQTKVLAGTREKLDAIEVQLAKLAKKPAAKPKAKPKSEQK